MTSDRETRPWPHEPGRCTYGDAEPAIFPRLFLASAIFMAPVLEIEQTDFRLMTELVAKFFDRNFQDFPSNPFTVNSNSVKLDIGHIFLSFFLFIQPRVRNSNKFKLQ